MASKRNKLLIFLGLVTVAVSKSHNQRFDVEYEFESQRTSASKLSAKPSHATAKKADFQFNLDPSLKLLTESPEDSYQDYISALKTDESNTKTHDKLTRRSSGDEYDHMPYYGRMSRFGRRRQAGKNGNTDYDSSEPSVEIDPRNFFFEPKKVNSARKRRPSEHHGNYFSRRTGLLIPDTENPNPDLAEQKEIKETEKKSREQKKEAEKEKSPEKDAQKPRRDDTEEIKTEEKTKPKRKKVVRLRVRGQNRNKTRKNDIKLRAKSVEREKLIEITSTNTEATKDIKEAKIPIDKLPVIKNPPLKSKVTEAKIKAPKLLIQKDNIYSSRKNNGTKLKIPVKTEKQSKNNEMEFKQNKNNEMEFKQNKNNEMEFKQNKNNEMEFKQSKSALEPTQNNTKAGESENDDHYVTFFRRSGKKLSSLYGAQTEPSKPDWISKYKTDKQDEDDSSYVMSFNYKGNKNHPTTDVVHIPQTPSKKRQSKNVHGHQNKAPFQETDDYPQEELNIAQLEKFADKFIERKRKVVKYDTTNQNADTYGTRGKDITPINDDKGESEYFPKNIDTVEDENDQNLPQQQNLPTVTLKRKKNRKQSDAIWKLQKQKEDNPSDEDWKHSSNSDEDWKHSSKSIFENQDNIKFDDHKSFQNNPTTHGTNYFVQSFLKLPSLDKTAMNIKGDEVLTGKISPHEDHKEFSALRKPLLPLENKGSGNYFMHMYKQVGNVGEFSSQTGESPKKNGYMSSLRLSWNDDDTKARVDEAVDSRALIPTLDHSLSIESSNSHENTDTDTLATGSSENIMEFKPHYVDDFMNPLQGDKSHFSDSIPVVHRHKRSLEDLPRLTSHFKIGESKVESNYTLEHKPTSKILNMRLNPTPKNNQIGKVQPIVPVQTQSRNAGERAVIIDKQKESNVKSYYRKPVAEKEIRQLKTEFKTNKTNLFDKYEMPSRNTAYTIFHSYQTPKRDLKQARDITLRFNVGKAKIKVPNKVGIRRRMDSQLHLNKEDNDNTTSLTTSETTIIQSSTDINASYMKTDKPEIKNKIYNESREIGKTTPRNPIFNLKRIQIRPTTQAISAQATVYPTTTQIPTTQTEVQKQFFHKSGDLSKAAQDPVKHSVIQSRRIGDQRWIYPQQDREDEIEHLQHDIGQHLENNYHGRKQEVLHSDDIPEHENQDLQSLSHGITPEVPFEWNNPDIQLSSENDHPTYHTIPRTHFTCQKRTPGYYADPETGCQVFHMCHGTGVKHSFLCPNTTIFNQRLLVCDWHSKVNCDTAESFYDVNDRIYEYQSEEKSDRKPQSKKLWNTLQPKQNTDSKYSRFKEEKYSQNKYQSKPAVNFQDKEVTDVPQFIVNHFKENIPHAEFDKPKGITKSYSTVIGEPKSEITSTTKSYLGNYHLNEYETPIPHDKYLSKTGDRVITEEYTENQKPIKSSWDTKEMQKTMEHELLTIPESEKTIEDGEKIYYLYPLQQNSHHDQTSEKSKNSNFLIENTYEPPLDDSNKYLEDDEIHYAGRQNEKVIIVNRERLPNVYESSSNRDYPDSKATILKEETQTKFTLPMTTVTQSPYKHIQNNIQKERKLFDSQSIQDSHQKNKDGLSTNQASRYQYNGYNTGESKKQSYTEARSPQYIYPLPGIIQNDDGTRGFNYGYRVEDPKSINSAKAQIFKLGEPRVNTGLIIKQNNDAAKDFKTVNLPKAQILKLNEPRTNVGPVAKQNVNTRTVPKAHNLQKVHIFQLGEQRANVGPIAKQNVDTKTVPKPHNLQNAHIFQLGEPRANVGLITKQSVGTPISKTLNLQKAQIFKLGEPRSNVGLITKQSVDTPISKTLNLQNAQVFKLGEPRLNTGIITNQNVNTKTYPKTLNLPNAQIFKQEEPRANVDLIKNIGNDMGKNLKSVNLQTAQIFKLGEPRSNTDLILKQKGNSEDDPRAKKVKLRIAEIKSGVESIGAQVGKILGGDDDNTFKNIRVFKLQPHKSKEEFQEIRLSPFKFERNPRIPTNAKVNEEKKQRIAFNANKNIPNVLGNINKESKSNIRVRPIISAESLQNSKTKVIQNAPNNYGHTQTYMAIPNLVHKVATDIAPKFKEVPTQSQKTLKIDKNIAELRPYNQMIKAMPPSGRNSMISNVKSDLKPVNIHNNNNNLNLQKILLRTQPRPVDSNSETKISSISVDENNKKYEIRYIPVIKLDHSFQIRPHEKQPVLDNQKATKIVPDLTNEQSEEHYEHIYVPKKLPEGRTSSFFVFPEKINVHDNSEEFRGNPVALGNAKYPYDHVKHNIKHTLNSAHKHESEDSDTFDGKTIKIKPTTQQTTDTEPRFQTPIADTPKKFRTFVVISKPALGTQSKKPKENYAYNTINPTETPVMTTINVNIKTDLSPSTECDDSASSVQNSFTPVNLGKNGPPHNSIKTPLAGPFNGANTGELRTQYNPQDESTSKCRDHGDSKVQNEDSKSPELSARQKNLDHKKVSFYPKPTSKIALKDLRQPKFAYLPDKTAVKFNTKSFEKAVPKSPLIKPVKLFQIQRNSRPAFMAPMTTQTPIFAITTVKEPNYQLSQEKTEELSSEESRENSDKKSIDRSKRANGRRSRYANLEREAELRTTIKNPQNMKKFEKSFPVARNKPQAKRQRERSSSESTSKSNNHSRQSRYAALERAAELEAERMIQTKSHTTQSYP